jgi:hypothetical protein
MARVKVMHDKDADQCIHVSVKDLVKDPRFRMAVVPSALKITSGECVHLIGIVDSVEVWCNCRKPKAPLIFFGSCSERGVR